MGLVLMKTTTEMQLVSVDKLVPYANNARTHSPEQINKLRSSLREFGFINPVIIDRDYGVIAGHGRIEAAKAEGIKEVPCVFADHLTEAQKKAYIIADNRMALDAGWDEELLRVEIEALQGEDFDLALTGFDEKELSDLFGTGDDNEAKDDDFDLSEALEKASFVEHGDIWTVGRHRLMCGDATSADDVSALMDGKKANLVVTDPPYGVSFKSSDGLTIQNDSIKGEEFYTFLYNAFTNMAAHLEKGGAAYVFHADTEGLNFRKAFIDAGFHLAGVCIWVKNSLVLGRSDYAEVEPFCIAVTRKNFPDVKHYGDVSAMDGGKIEPVDIITFGSPCQDMSIAGKRSGLDGERSSLFYEAVRIVKEMRCATGGKYPRYIVWENVPGAFSSNGGEDFRCVLEEICKVKDERISVPESQRWTNAGEILGDGFSLAWRVLDAQYWGVPQRRKRIFLVADFADTGAGKILFESESLPGHLETCFSSWQRVAGSPPACIGTPSLCLNDQGSRQRLQNFSQEATPLTRRP